MIEFSKNPKEIVKYYREIGVLRAFKELYSDNGGIYWGWLMTHLTELE